MLYLVSLLYAFAFIVGSFFSELARKKWSGQRRQRKEQSNFGVSHFINTRPAGNYIWKRQMTLKLMTKRNMVFTVFGRCERTVIIDHSIEYTCISQSYLNWWVRGYVWEQRTQHTLIFLENDFKKYKGKNKKENRKECE